MQTGLVDLHMVGSYLHNQHVHLQHQPADALHSCSHSRVQSILGPVIHVHNCLIWYMPAHMAETVCWPWAC